MCQSTNKFITVFLIRVLVAPLLGSTTSIPTISMTFSACESSIVLDFLNSQKVIHSRIIALILEVGLCMCVHVCAYFAAK